MMLRKQGALNNQMLRLGCGLLSPIKIPGYVPVAGSFVTLLFANP